MAIRDLKQRLETQEGESGEALKKTLKKALDEVYGDAKGWQKFVGSQNKGLSIKGADSLWEQSYKEILDQAKKAVGAKKSDVAKEVLGDLISLTKDIAATKGVNVPIAAGIQMMLEAVQPSIQERVTVLKRGEGILVSMKKKAISSAVSSVESFASNILSPLPFGAGEAIIGKAKGFLNIGAKERRGAQAMDFASRLEEGGIETSGAGGGGAASGGIVSSRGGNGEGSLEKTNEILTEMEEHLQWMVDNMEDAETRRERMRDKGLKNAGGALVGTGMGDMEDGGSGFWSSLLGTGAGIAGFKGIRALFSGKGGLLSNLFRNLKAILLKQGKSIFGTAKLLPMLRAAGTFGKIGALSIPILGFAIDALIGAFEAEDWGVSVPAATIGSFFAGGEGGGWNSFGQAFKYGAMGAAIGSIVPGVGTIAGMILGSIIGALMGWVGGKRFAQSIQKSMESVSLSQKTVDDAVKDAMISQEIKDKEEKGEELTTGESFQKGVATSTATMAAATAGSGQVIVEAAKFIDPTYDSSTGKTASWVPESVRKLFPKGLISGAFIQALSASESDIYNTPKRHSGGPVGRSGTYELNAGEMVMDNQAAAVMMNAVSVAGATMNTLAMDRIGLNGRAGMGAPPAIIDNSTVQNISNNTVIRPPSPSGPSLQFERGDFVSKIA